MALCGGIGNRRVDISVINSTQRGGIAVDVGDRHGIALGIHQGRGVRIRIHIIRQHHPEHIGLIGVISQA